MQNYPNGDKDTSFFAKIVSLGNKVHILGCIYLFYSALLS